MAEAPPGVHPLLQAVAAELPPQLAVHRLALR